MAIRNQVNYISMKDMSDNKIENDMKNKKKLWKVEKWIDLCIEIYSYFFAFSVE